MSFKGCRASISIGGRAGAETLDRDDELIGTMIDALRDQGAIRSPISFPYARPIAGRSLAARWCDAVTPWSPGGLCVLRSSTSLSWRPMSWNGSGRGG
jgi:hypothetical protein